LFKSKEKTNGLVDYYFLTMRREETSHPVRLPKILPDNHPWKDCWEKSNIGGSEIIPASVRIICA